MPLVGRLDTCTPVEDAWTKVQSSDLGHSAGVPGPTASASRSLSSCAGTGAADGSAAAVTRSPSEVRCRTPEVTAAKTSVVNEVAALRSVNRLYRATAAVQSEGSAEVPPASCSW